MPYTPEQIREMQDMLNDWSVREDALTVTLFTHPFGNPAAREMMRHGFSRRVADLQHGIERIFEILPPDAVEPSLRDRRDATVFLQAFFINTFGAMDNLAWVWALEADVRHNGKPLHRTRIGLTPDHRQLRASLSQATQAYLQTSNDWFGYLEEYRHALAHRIPLYIPPKTINEAEGIEFKRLEDGLMAAGWTPDGWGQVLAAQQALGVFEPLIMHSYAERAIPMRFHAQIICDFATVIETAEHVVTDLQARQRPAP